MTRLLGGIVLLVALTVATADACPPVLSTPVYRAPVTYAAPAVVTTYTPPVTPVLAVSYVPVAVPTFSVTYSPPAVVQAAPAVAGTALPAAPAAAAVAPPRAAVQTQAAGVAAPAAQPAAAQNGNAELLLEIQRLRKELDALKAGQTAPPAAQQSEARVDLPTAVTRVTKAKCAACHDASVAEQEGGRLVLMDGEALAPVPDRKVPRLMSLVYANRMPPPNNAKGIQPLTDQEAAALIEFHGGAKTAAQQP